MSTLTQELKDTTDLDEKLMLIDEMLAKAEAKKQTSGFLAPVDPAELTLCIGCQ